MEAVVVAGQHTQSAAHEAAQHAVQLPLQMLLPLLHSHANFSLKQREASLGAVPCIVQLGIT